MKKVKTVLLLMMVVLLTAPVSYAAKKPSTFDQREVKFSRIMNARDLGGYKTVNGRYVKQNVLIRSAELSTATVADLTKLRKQYRLKRVYDFRHPNDYKYCPDKRIKGVTYVCLPIESGGGRSVSSAKNRHRTMLRMSDGVLRNSRIKAAKRAGKKYAYQIVMSSYSQKQYRKYFDYLLTNKDANGVLIHCVHGKDRTGVAAFMTLIALGVPESTAYKDYSLTNDWMIKYNKRYYNRYDIGVRTSELRYAVEKAKKKYGTMGRFLNKAYGLDNADLSKLRRIYTRQ